MTAPDALEPPTGLGFGVTLGIMPELGLDWSGFTCKFGIDDTRPEQSFLLNAAAHSVRRL